MAIPKSLKPIPKEKAEKLIRKHLKAGTGEYEYGPDLGDFLYNTKKGWYLWSIRRRLQRTRKKTIKEIHGFI